jgi:hypothetical protein
MEQILSRTNTSESATLGRKIYSVTESNPVSDNNYYNALCTKNSKLTNTLVEEIERQKPDSSLLLYDEERDDAIGLVFNEIEVKIAWPDATIRASAEVINGILIRYGRSIINLPYNDESAKLISIYDELSAPDLASHIDNIPGFSMLIDNLGRSIKNFQEREDQLTRDKIIYKDRAPASQIAKELKHFLNNIFIPYIDVMSRSDSTTFGNIQNLLSQIITDSNNSVRRRLKNSSGNDV